MKPFKEMKEDGTYDEIARPNGWVTPAKLLQNLHRQNRRKLLT